MDGHFVPNLTLGAPIVKALRKHTDAFLDCHLMVRAGRATAPATQHCPPHTPLPLPSHQVAEPEKWVDDFASAGASQFNFHVEACADPAALIDRIKATGMRAAVAVKPKTPVESVFPFADKLDMVLIMTVEPGFGGQSFMEDMMPKVQELRRRYPTLDIQVDGGLSPSTIDAASAAGANVIVAGTAIFKADDPPATIRLLRESVEKAMAAAAVE